MPALAPDLAVEVLSESNTRAEMDRKLRDYFAAGVLLVWYFDPRSGWWMSSRPWIASLDLTRLTLWMAAWFSRLHDPGE